jgi:Tfp pilus assembly protein PilF
MPRRVVRRDGPRAWAVLALLAAAALARAAAADPPDPKAAPPAGAAPAPKALAGDDARKVAELNKAIDELWRAGQFAEALGPAQQAAAVCEKALGPDHWRAADARRKVKTLNTIAGLPEEGRRALATVPALRREGRAAYEQASYTDSERLERQLSQIYGRWLGEGHPGTAASFSNLANALRAQGRLAEAEALHRRALAARQRVLGEGYPNTAASYNNLGCVLYTQGKLAEAEALHRQALAIRQGALGEGHPDTAASYNNLAIVLRDQGSLPEAEALYRRALAIALKALGERHPAIAICYDNLALVLRDQWRLAEAEALHRKALAIRLKALGAGHPDTARSYDQLAAVLRDQDQLAEAEALHRKALAIRLKALGAGHPDTARSYDHLGFVLSTQGRLAEAEALHRKALAIRLKALGEGHPDTARSYSNLAAVLGGQGRLQEEEALFRRALAIRLKALGAGHPDTARSYNQLAVVLWYHGRLPQAEELHRRALAIDLKALGAGHPDTAWTYDNLAVDLSTQGRLAEAEALHRRALAARVEARGEGHPESARSSNNLALVLRAQGKLAEAEALHRRALAIDLKARGEGHPDTAGSFSNLANVLRAQGKLAEAEALHRKALVARQRALGAGHPDTACCYLDLAYTLDRLGRADEARDALTAAADVFDRARLRGDKGLESALGSDEYQDPAPALAVALARAGRGRDAWGRWERGLARAVRDETAGRAARPLTPDERAREADLLRRNQAADERIGRLAGRPRLTQQDEARLDDLRREAGELRRQLLDLQLTLEEKYGPLAGQPVALDEAQAALPDDAALVGWIDKEIGHAACVVRRAGEPAWVMIPGTGQDGEWTKEEQTLAERLPRLAARAAADDWRPLAAALAAQRLVPIEPHLKGVKRVIVVNTPGIAGVPVEVLLAARGAAGREAPVVAYAPSASIFTDLASAKSPADRPAALLALGDPAYPPPEPAPSPPAPPDHGLFVVQVEANGVADLFGVRSGDVLLEYDGKALTTRDDLQEVAAAGGPKKVPLRLWRAGQTRAVEVAAGPLGVRLDSRPAAPVVLAQRAAAEVLHPVRGEVLARLDGTRLEVAAIAGLFPAEGVKTLLGDEARESVVQGLARSGRLKGYRYLHFAAHGRDDPRSAYRTALLLAPNPESPDNPGAVDTDGEITAEQIARTWDLDADLVVLSACETALGKQAGGEGFLGFAQPLLAKGARSLVLSLWKVDDQATALLMARFYQNLLGKRPGLSRPMAKAEALGEAKAWLRDLTGDEAGAAQRALDRGTVRPQATAGQAGPGEEAGAAGRPAGRQPYAHPYYWAAFVLVGDPG